MEELNYEQAVQRLEAIVQKLEGGHLPLEEIMALYEEGSALAVKCAKQLDAAQLKITELAEKGEASADA